MALRELFKAIKNNRINEVRNALMGIKNINGKNGNGQTPLHFAAELSKDKITTLLLESGANPKAKDLLGRTPLYFAFVREKITLANLLIENGATIKGMGRKHDLEFLFRVLKVSKNDFLSLLEKEHPSQFKEIKHLFNELFPKTDQLKYSTNHPIEEDCQTPQNSDMGPICLTFTKFIRQSKIKSLLRETYNRPTPPKEIGTPLSPRKTNNWRILGHATDFLIKISIFKNLGSKAKNQLDFGYLYATSRKLDNGERIFKKYKKQIENHIENKTGENELFEPCLYLAYFEAMYRSGWTPDNIPDLKEDDLIDLKNINSLIDTDTFKPKDSIYFSPNFNVNGSLVGVAEGDLIIDDKLIEVKTVQNTSDNTNHWNQLIGYYILGRFNGIRLDSGKSRKVDINHVGIYYARHGKLVLKDICDLISDSKTEKKLKQIFFEN